MLQEEIEESSLRLKQAKFGHKLVDIVPNHENSFYLLVVTPSKVEVVTPSSSSELSDLGLGLCFSVCTCKRVALHGSWSRYVLLLREHDRGACRQWIHH